MKRSLVLAALLLQGCNTVPIKVNPPPPPPNCGPACKHVTRVHVSKHEVFIGFAKGW